MTHETSDTLAVKLRWAVRELGPFDGICPRDCSLCEEKETLVLIPGEAETIAEEVGADAAVKGSLLRMLKDADGSDKACPMQCTACKSCEIYPTRPIDCRSFPVVPEFSADGRVQVRVSRSYCPIADDLPDGFVQTVQRVWQELSPHLPDDWKRRYNATPSPT
ncbi:MAG: hypothetical protein IID41_10220 [Planctomycetes bacterium]|nr:hypothetical protein [Planctomycetota bacterium]